jgi:hypothetical protein
MWGMSFRLTALMLVIAGCSASGTPATVPPSTPATASTVAVTTTAPPTTTTTHATTTTVDRLAEIEAVFQDLEERRLQALYEGDEETFKSLFANKEYMQRSLGAFDAVEFKAPPEDVNVQVLRVMSDEEACIAALVSTSATASLGVSAFSENVVVIERGSNGWGLSYAGEGWTCEGPHPFSP